MNVEDSYEGAVRRLRRLGHIDVTPPHVLREREESQRRMRELEELATLACDENEQLKAELDGARGEIERLKEHVVTLQQQVLAATKSAERIAEPRARGRGGIFYFLLVIVVLGYGAAGGGYFYRPSLVYRSADEVQSLLGTATASVPAALPVVAAPVVPPPAVPAAQPVAAPVEAAQPDAPAAEPAAAAAATDDAEPESEPAPVKAKSHHHHSSSSKHHEAKSAKHEEHKRAPAKAAGSTDTSTDDPLGGLGGL